MRIFLRIGQPAIRFLARSPLRDALVRGFGDSISREGFTVDRRWIGE